MSSVYSAQEPDDLQGGGVVSDLKVLWHNIASTFTKALALTTSLLMIIWCSNALIYYSEVLLITVVRPSSNPQKMSQRCVTAAETGRASLVPRKHLAFHPLTGALRFSRVSIKCKSGGYGHSCKQGLKVQHLLQIQATKAESVCGSDHRLRLSNDDMRDVFVTSFAELPGLILAALLIDVIGRKRQDLYSPDSTPFLKR